MESTRKRTQLKYLVKTLAARNQHPQIAWGKNATPDLSRSSIQRVVSADLAQGKHAFPGKQGLPGFAVVALIELLLKGLSGGHIEEGETTREGVMREFAEELVWFWFFRPWWFL